MSLRAATIFSVFVFAICWSFAVRAEVKPEDSDLIQHWQDASDLCTSDEVNDQCALERELSGAIKAKGYCWDYSAGVWALGCPKPTPSDTPLVDEYLACMIGKSFAELMRQPEAGKDISLAQGVAYGQCHEPDDYGSAVNKSNAEHPCSGSRRRHA